MPGRLNLRQQDGADEVAVFTRALSPPVGGEDRLVVKYCMRA